MGECAYFLKAEFISAAAAKKAQSGIKQFIKEANEAYNYWQDNRGPEDSKVFWKEFKRKFPLVTEYTLAAGLFGGNDLNDLSGNLDFGQEDNQVQRNGNIISYTASTVWHFADWSHFADFIKSKYGARKVVWSSEENDCGGIDSLNLYEWEEIVRIILNQKKILPVLLGLHDDLDALIEPLLKRTLTKLAQTFQQNH